MGTANFRSITSSRIFSVVPDTEDEDEFEAQDTLDFSKENVLEKLKALGYSEDNTNLHAYDNRSYPSSTIASKRLSKKYGTGYLVIEIYVLVINGYYAGVNYDYVIEHSFGGPAINTVLELAENAEEQNVFEEIMYYCYDNEGMAKIQLKNIEKYMRKTVEELQKEVEAVLEESTTVLRKVGTFSSGEAIYEKAE